MIRNERKHEQKYLFGLRDAYTYRQTIGIVSENNRYSLENEGSNDFIKRVGSFHQKSRLLTKKHPLKGWMKTIDGMDKMSYKFIKI